MNSQKDIITLYKLLAENDSKKIVQYKRHFQTSVIANSFSEFICDKMAHIDNLDHSMTRYDLAEALGFSGEKAKKVAEILKKIINTSGYTTSRDRIILICFALKLTYPETNKALQLYMMLPLNEYNLREKTIIAALYKGDDINTVNDWLIKLDQPILSFEIAKKTKKATIINEPIHRYEIIQPPQVTIGNFTGDSSLSNFYSPYKYRIDAVLSLSDKNGTLYELCASDDNTYEIISHYTDGRTEVDHFPSLQDCFIQEFCSQFYDLDAVIGRKVKEFLTILDDTKNYNIRYNISLEDYSLKIYTETFNYSNPERSEYYQMTKTGDSYFMTISNTSYYLQHHLGVQYRDFYPNYHEEIFMETYNSLSEIENSSQRSYIKNERKKAYIFLRESIFNLLEKLRLGEAVIFDVHEFCSDWYEVASFFQIQEYFTWIFDENNGEQYTENPSCEYCDNNGKKHIITLDELKRALELGISNLQDFLLIRTEHSSIESLLD